MSTQDSYDQTIKELMAQWQKQWGAVMSDKQFIHAMLDALQSMRQGVYGATTTTQHSNPTTSPDDDERVAKLTARLAACEKRVTELESAIAKSSKPVRRAAKPRAAAKKPANEAANHASEVLNGLLRYLDAPCKSHQTDKPVIWEEGSSCLIDYGTSEESDVSVLFVPSLINRHYILDLAKKRSLLGFVADQGHHSFVLDWGVPDAAEYEFDCTEYIQQRLIPAIKFLHKKYKKPVVLAGYCMGGVLAIAAAQLLPKEVAGLALFATPWDFHCKEFSSYLLDKPYQNILDKILQNKETIPASVIQAMFYMTDPWVFEQKYSRFYGFEEDSAAAKEFIALEHWVNDGVPMSMPLARDCLIDWAQKNHLHKGLWQVSGKKINPECIKQPVFIAIPQNDHVVPYDCATALLPQIPHARVVYPDAGHVSMIVGSKAKEELWKPLSSWIASI